MFARRWEAVRTRYADVLAGKAQPEGAAIDAPANEDPENS